MILTIEEIAQRLAKVKAMWFVKSLRNGPTGIGYTLETLLEIDENNISAPDFGEIELKAQRERHSGMTTLFTFNNKAWKMKPLEAIKKYGSYDKDGRQWMYYTMGLRPNSHGLFMRVTDDDIIVQHIDWSIIAVWQLWEVERRFEKKVKNVLLVKAQVEVRDGIEYFYYDRARLLSGWTTKSILKSQFENWELLLDLRLHDKWTSARNHWTGFRIFENNIETLYKTVIEITF